MSTTTFVCECEDGWNPCGKRVELTYDTAQEIWRKGLMIIVNECPNGPSPTDQLVEMRDGYSLYREN